MRRFSGIAVTVLVVCLALGCAILAWLIVGRVEWLFEVETSLMHDRCLAVSPISRQDNVVVVAVNDRARAALGASENILLRPRYAELLDRIGQTAELVLFDLEFRGDGPGGDEALVAALNRAHAPVVLIANHVVGTAERGAGPVAFVKPDLAVRVGNPRVVYGTGYPFEVGGRMRGIVARQTDYQGVAWQHVSLQAADAGAPFDVPDIVWIRMPSLRHATPIIDLDEALANPERLDGKIVVVGETSGDQVMGPRGRASGTELNAWAIRTLLDRAHAVPWLSMWQALLVASLLAIPAALAANMAKRTQRLSLQTSALCGAVALPWIFAQAQWAIMPTIGPILSVALSIALTSSFATVLTKSKTQTDATIVFIDLVGFTPLTVELGDDGIRDLMSHFHREIGGLYEKHGAVIERTLGDAILLRFAGPDPAKRVRTALEASLAAHRRVTDLERHLPQPRRLAVTIGIEDGPVSGLQVETRRHEEWSSFGSAINLAARLQALCGKERLTIAVGPQAASHCPPGLLTHHGDFELKGFDGATPVYTVLILD